MNDSLFHSDYEQLSDLQFDELDLLSDRFDSELVNGQNPSIEEYLEQAAKAAEADLLGELLAMEIEFRATRREQLQRNDYLQRFPQHESVIARVFDRQASAEASDSDGCSDTPRTAVPVSAAPVLPGFRLISELGSGGMGVVWLAEQLEPVRRRVAVKLIRSGLTSRDALARFDAEKQALAIMHHPHIARVLDAGTLDDGRPYFVMELVEGVPVHKYCDEHRLSIDERLKLFVTVCKAVQHAHQKGIIHRDLKPSNVLVTEVDGEAVPKVIDFGLAKAVEQDLQLSELTMHTEFGKVVGTVRYMSPEQADLDGTDAGAVDTRTDVYSLGVMLYELLTGSTPVDKDTLADQALLKVLEIVRQKDPLRPSRRLSSSSHEVSSSVSELRRMQPAGLRKLLQGELDWVVMRAIEKDPDRRYQTANDLAQDVSNYLTGETVTARPPSTWYRIQKFANRNRGLVTAVLAIAVALLVGIAGTTYGLIRANEKTELAEDKTREAEANAVAALLERSKAEANERRAIAAEDLASAEAQRVRDSEAAAKFQLAVARWEANRARDARQLLHEIAPDYRDTFEWHLCKRRFQGSDVTCYGHTAAVCEVAFTPDGKRIVSAGDTGIIRVWDAVTGEQLSASEGHEGRVEGLDVSPDGSWFVSGSRDGTVKVRDADSGVVIHTLSGHEGGINCVAFSPAGDRIASASDDTKIKLWDPTTGEELLTISGHQGAVTGIAFSPNGEQIASTSKSDYTVRIWSSQDGEELSVVRRGRDETRRLAFSPDGTRLATVSYSRFSLWDTKTWQLVLEDRHAHDHVVTCVAFSPDGARFATGGVDTTIRLWETKSGRPLTTLTGHAETVWGLGFSPDGSRLASAAEDGTVKIWGGFGAAGGNELKLTGHPGGGSRVAFSADCKLYATGGGEGRILLRDARTHDVLQTLEGHVGGIGGLSFNDDGTSLASGGDDGTVRLWDTRTGQSLAVMHGHRDWIRGLAFSPDGTQIATAGWDGTARLWDPTTHEEIATLKGHGGGLYHVAFSADGSLLASTSSDRTVKLWDARTRQEIRTLHGPVGPARAVAFGPRAERLASVGYDPKIRTWDVASGEQITAGNSTSDAVFGFALSPDGTRIVTASTDTVVHLYDALNGNEILGAFSHGGLAATFSPDGRRLAAAGGGSTPLTLANIQIWDAPREHETSELRGHTDKVTQVSFSPDGTRVYSTSENERLVWDVESGKPISDAMWEPPEAAIRTSADGRWFVLSESNNVVLVDLQYKHRPEELGYRTTKSAIDPSRHHWSAFAAIADEDWYAGVCQYAWLLKNDPECLAYRFGLRSAYARLAARSAAEFEALSRVPDATGNHVGTFYSRHKKHMAATVPTAPLTTSADSPESSAGPAHSGHAMFFDGASYADLGKLPFYGTDFTVEGWIKHDTSQLGVLDFQANVHTDFVFKVHSSDGKTAVGSEIGVDGTLRVMYRNPPANVGGVNIFSRSDVADGEWHHFAVVKAEDGILRLYIDGEQEASSEAAVVDFGNAPSRTRLGMNVRTAPRYFRGLMDEFRFWNVARTEAEIRSSLNTAIAPNSDGLVAHFNFEPSLTEPTDKPPAATPPFPPSVSAALDMAK